MSIGEVGEHPDFAPIEMPSTGISSEQKQKIERIVRQQLAAFTSYLKQASAQCSKLLRVAWGIASVGGRVPAALRVIGSAWGPIICSISSISLINLTIGQISALRKIPAGSPRSEYLKTIFRPFVPDRPLLQDICMLAYGVLFSVKTLAKSVPAAVGTACMVLGTVSGALVIISGFTKVGLELKEAVTLHKKIQDLRKKGVDESELKALKWDRTKALLKAAQGGLVTAGGALIIAAVFVPPAYPLLAIALAALSLSIATSGISLGMMVKQRRDNKKSAFPTPKELHNYIKDWVEETKNNWKEFVDYFGSKPLPLQRPLQKSE